MRRQPAEAEQILLGANLVYRAIRGWIDLFNWDRALDIALKFKTHVDTVFYFREKYLKALNKPETIKKYLQYSQGLTIDWEAIQAKIANELEQEASGKLSKGAMKPSSSKASVQR